MTRIWWVRHGPTHAKTLTGWSDIAADLSDTAALGRLAHFLPAAPILSSDLLRTRMTADAIQGTRPRLPDDPDLREASHGDWEGVNIDLLMTDPRFRTYLEQPGDISPPGGESWNALSARIDRAVLRLADLREVIVVSHAGVIATRLALALQLSPYAALGHHIAPLSVTVIGPDGVEVLHHEA